MGTTHLHEKTEENGQNSRYGICFRANIYEFDESVDKTADMVYIIRGISRVLSINRSDCTLVYHSQRFITQQYCRFDARNAYQKRQYAEHVLDTTILTLYGYIVIII